jgi:predicted kinase
MIDLFLIRGLPSAGKSTLINRFKNIHHFETDQFFTQDGQYKFDYSKLTEAHAWCLEQVRKTIVFLQTIDHNSQEILGVSNTFVTRKSMQPYIELAKEFNIQLTVVDLFDGGCDDETLFLRNKHGVPLETFKSMRAQYEHDWKNGNI